MQNMNEGTRTVDNPLENGKVRREVVRNEIPYKTLKTCNLLHDHGSLFTLKNPHSRLWLEDPQNAGDPEKLRLCQGGLGPV